MDSAARGLRSQCVMVADPAEGAPQQLMIFYGGWVVVLDGCKPAKAADLILHAAAAASRVGLSDAAKASLQRFLSQRKDRIMHGRDLEEEAAPRPSKKRNTQASSWLSLVA